MVVVGLTGGIGAGKSTLAALLAERGAIVVDADVFAHRAVDAGSDGFGAVVASFGEEVVGSAGEIDRAALAAIVFANPDRLRQLEAIVHPVVREMVSEVIDAHRGTDAIVVIDTPFLPELDDGATTFTVVVTAPRDVRLERLRQRGMSEADAKARMAAQPTDEQRGAVDLTIANEGTPSQLAGEAERLWSRLQELEADRT
jgi:dephospho-CoA kinase